ncbi:MAG: NAD(P)-binding domain-containing protein [Paracoccaceae bacterium]
MRGVGIAGSGRACRSFLSRLRAAGIQAEGYGLSDRDSRGALCAPEDSADFGIGLTTLILVPADIAEAEALLFEDIGLARCVPTLETIVVAATLSPRYVRALRGRIPVSITLIDAPFGGTLRAAEEGRISFYLGGSRDEIARLDPIFTALGQKTVRMGAFGSGIAAKVMNDLVAASTNAITRLALDWAGAQGIDEANLLEMSENSTDGVLPARFPAMLGDDSIATFVEDIENLMSSALSDAQLTPPHAIASVYRAMRSRALH